MILAIVAKTLRDARLLLMLLLAAIVIFEFIFVFAVGNTARDVLKLWEKFPFIMRMMSALVGADISSSLTTTSLLTIGFAHPFVYATTWAFLITVCTRVLVAEFDRGTADLLLTLPISRAALYGAVSLVWMALAVPISLAPWLGLALGALRFPLDEPLAHDRLRLVALNFAALYLCIGCVATWIASMTTRRGVAVALVLGILLFSFVWNFLVALVPEMRAVPLPLTDATLDLGVFGLLNFYRPLEIIRTGEFPWRDVLALLTVSVAAWAAGLLHFSRRDIPAA